MIAAINDAGIHQFLTKPWHPDQLIMAAKNASQLFELARDHERMSLEMRFLGCTVENKLENQRKTLRESLGFENVIRSLNSPLNATVEQARQLANFDVPVLITGEPGTGKAQLARAMHYTSLRSDHGFYELNCAGMSDELLMVELLGAKRGAVPGLPTNKIGLLQKADRGTLFLNGVESLSPQMQMILLRVVTEGSFQPLGGHEVLRTNIRLLAGSQVNLLRAVEQGHFRNDLYYGLATTELSVPPLRGRVEDLSVLAQHMLFDLALRHGKPVNGLTDLSVEFLSNYEWPGNLRELENELARMLIAAQDVLLGPELISRHILQADPSLAPRVLRADTDVLSCDGAFKERVEIVEMRILRETLARLKWKKSRAAFELGLSRVGLRAKPDRYGIHQPDKINANDEED